MPTTMVVADFNGDGKADIATANNRDRGISVLLGDGTGKFTPAPGSPLNPMSSGPAVIQVIASGDFNGDGHQDLVAGNAFNTVILLGGGAGDFTKGANVGPSNEFIGSNLILVGDFNGDGKLDLITDFNGSTFLLPGDGTGAFGSPQNSPLRDPAIGSIVAGDFNGDGKTDVASIPLLGSNGTFQIFAGDGAGHFQTVFNYQPGSSLTQPHALAATADFNGDGKADILTFANGASQVWSWTGNTSNILTTFGSTSSADPGMPSYVATGDFDGDGHADWAGVYPADGIVTVSLGDGAGHFTAAPGSPYFVGGTPLALAAGDFNNDGRLDLAVDTGSAVVILTNGISPLPGPPPSIKANGVVPVFSTQTTVQTGEWASIYGTNLGSTATWSGDFPKSLGGASVIVDGIPAYLWYVSPTQINFQVPDIPSGLGSGATVVVNTPSGTATSGVNLASSAPSFSVIGGKYVAGIILRQNGTGAYAGGTYDILGPTGSSLGFPTVAAKAGDQVELFAVGLGPTNPGVPAGQAFFGAAPTTGPVSLSINKVNVIPTFTGLVEAGLYQINLILPAGLGTGDLPIVIGATPSTVVIPVR